MLILEIAAGVALGQLIWALIQRFPAEAFGLFGGVIFLTFWAGVYYWVFTSGA
jgi:hypothetical protein